MRGHTVPLARIRLRSWQPPAPINAMLESTVAVEALAIPRGLPLPFGLSLLAVARAA